MIDRFTLIASLFVLLTAQAQTPVTPPAKVAVAPLASASAGHSREKKAEVCTSAPRSE